jgi:hypothetical protein
LSAVRPRRSAEKETVCQNDPPSNHPRYGELGPERPPVDGLLDFANGLRGALSEIDTNGSMADINAELLDRFEAFVIWQEPDDDGAVWVQPLLKLSVAQALVGREDVTKEDLAPWLLGANPERPPMKCT